MRVFIVGGGPSLKGFDFSRLRDEITISMNWQFRLFVPTILNWNDGRMYEGCKSEIDALDCIKITNDRKLFGTKDVYGYPVDREVCHGPEGLVKGIYTDFLTGLSAISLALAFGFKEIYLLGLDCNRGHHYDVSKAQQMPGRPPKQAPEPDLTRHVKYFDEFVKWVGEEGIGQIGRNRTYIYDCSLQGNLRQFPKVSIDDVLTTKTQRHKEEKTGEIERIKGLLSVCTRT